MAPAPVAVDVCYGRSTAHVLCAGEIDVSSVAKLKEALDGVLARHPRTVMFNGIAIDVLACVGIEALADAATKCRLRGIDFELILNDHGWRVLDLVHARPLMSREEGTDYEFPHEVADALTGVTRP